MCSLDASQIIPIASLAFAVTSPILSSLITGWFRLKEKKLDLIAEQKKQNQQFYEEHRAEAIENYLRSAGQAIYKNDHFDQFGSGMSEIYLYVDESIWPLIDALNSSMENGEYEKAVDKLIVLSKKLAAEKVRYYE